MSTHEDSDLTVSNNEHFRVTSRCDESRSFFEWRIQNFSLCPSKNLEAIYSPSFSCSSVEWYLGLYPNGNEAECEGYVSIILFKFSSETETTAEYKICLKDKDGNHQYAYKSVEKVFPTKSQGRGWVRFIKREILFGEKNAELLPDGMLTVCCEISVKKDIIHSTVERLTESLAQKNDKSISCLNTLPSTLEKLYENQKFSDVTIRTSEKDFRVHKNILAAYSPVFEAMFENDMNEARSGVVEIDDVVSPVMNDFIRFMYTGKVDNLSYERAVELFVVSDKYAVEDLKTSIADFICRNLTIDNFYEVALLADTYEEKSVMKSIENFFVSNAFAVLSRDEWDELAQKQPLLVSNIRKGSSR